MIKLINMNITNIINITNARDNLYNLVHSVIEFNEVPVITAKSGNAVLMSWNDYTFLCKMIELVPKFEDSNVVKITNARNDLYNLVDSVIKNEKAINITNNKGSVILMSWKEYRSLCETVYIFSIPGLTESIIKASKTPLSECVQMNKIDWDKVDEF